MSSKHYAYSLQAIDICYLTKFRYYLLFAFWDAQIQVDTLSLLPHTPMILGNMLYTKYYRISFEHDKRDNTVSKAIEQV